MSLRSTITVAWPERQISPISRFPVEKDSEDFEGFSTIRPYARWRMELFPGVMARCRPSCTLVLRKINCSAAVCGCVFMEAPYRDDLTRFECQGTRIQLNCGALKEVGAL